MKKTEEVGASKVVMHNTTQLKKAQKNKTKAPAPVALQSNRLRKIAIDDIILAGLRWPLLPVELQAHYNSQATVNEAK